MTLEVKNLTLSYENDYVLKDISFNFNSNEILCILGKNGAGKSTLLKSLINHIYPTSGKILLDGKDLKTIKAKDLAKKFAFIAQDHNFAFGFNCIDIVMMGANPHLGYFSIPGKKEKENALYWMDFLNISHLCNQPITQTSGGQKQLVMIAAALNQKASVLILDEPTAHLDFGNAHRLIELIFALHKKNIGIIMSTHFPDQALFLDAKTMILQDGKMFDFSNAHDCLTQKNLQQLYGINVQIKEFFNQKFCLNLKSKSLFHDKKGIFLD